MVQSGTGVFILLQYAKQGLKPAHQYYVSEGASCEVLSENWLVRFKKYNQDFTLRNGSRSTQKRITPNNT